jgi:HSP20 family molecular chaperone IbpA
MPSDHPQTPESPSQASLGVTNTHRKTSTSPQVSNSLPTPAHSINGSISALGADSMASGFSQEDPSNKRKRDVEDNGERDQKKVHLEAAGLSIEDLHLDVGEKYLLCRMRKTPFFLQDLIRLQQVQYP